MIEVFSVGDLVCHYDNSTPPEDIGIIIEIIPNDYYGIGVVLWFNGIIGSESLLFLSKLYSTDESNEGD
tara:strand:+ start:6701 stop:6907 length:207 start_codon:yes stop_codon:yes gene_type:complete